MSAEETSKRSFRQDESHRSSQHNLPYPKASAQTYGHPEIWIMGGTAISNYASLALTSFHHRQKLGLDKIRLKEKYLYVKSEFSIINPFNIEMSYELYRISLSIKFAVLLVKF